MKPVLASLLFLFALAFSSSANAKCFDPNNPPYGVVTPPTMQLSFTNNSSETVYIYIETPIRYRPGVVPPTVADLWLQAQCQILERDSYQRTFPETKLVRAFINVKNRAALGNSAQGIPPDPNAGVPPGKTVNITLPFWTQLRTDVTAANLGDVDQLDQFIDWWNAARVVIVYRVEGAVSLFDEDFPEDVPFTAASTAKPDCGANCPITYKRYFLQPDPHIGFQLQEYTFASAVGPLPGGSSKNPTFYIDTLAPNLGFRIKYAFPNLNYNVSSIDSVYLPIALGPMDPTKIGKPPIPNTDDTRYVGSGDTVSTFVGIVRAFSGQNADGSGWPYYIPMYFDSTQNVMCGSPPQLCWYPANFAPVPPFPPNTPNAPCSLNTHFRLDGLNNINTYVFPKIPGVANMLIESFRGIQNGIANNPVLLSGNPPNYQMLNGFGNNICHYFAGQVPFIDPPGLGTNGQQLFQLWKDCTGNKIPDVGGTCTNINKLNTYFIANYNLAGNSCKLAHQPFIPLDPTKEQDLLAIIYAVYGFVPIVNPTYPGPGVTPCIGPALDTAGQTPFEAIFGTYCDLQYNYLTLPNLPANNSYIFNPFVHLVHGSDQLNSTAYAFSVDDGVSFRQIHGSPGLMFAFGGTQAGLDFTTPTPPPTATTYKKNCTLK